MPQFNVLPLSVGAEIHGLDLDDPITLADRAALYDAWLDHGILLFRGVHSADAHLVLSRCFGELEIHPYPSARAAENALFIELGGSKAGHAYVYDETDLRVNRVPWHRDTAYTPDICKGAMLRMVESPSKHGETLFADTAAAYDDLPGTIKAQLDGLEYKASLRIGPLGDVRAGFFWTSARPATDDEDPVGKGRPVHPPNNVVTDYPSVVHPAVLIHPESGRKCLFLSPTYVDCFLGMDQAESDELLFSLVQHMVQPRYVYKHEWSNNDAIVWDNRRMMHAAAGNEPADPRRGLRTTFAGELRVGRYFDPSVAGAPVKLVD